MATNIAYHRNFDDTSSTELHADTDEYTEKKTCEATDQFEKKRVGDNCVVIIKS